MDGIENDTTNNCFIVACVFVAEIIFLGDRCLAMKVGIRIETHRLIGGIYEVGCWDVFRCRDVHTKFHKGWFSHYKVGRAEFIDTA
jgi:hypothetical protein